MGIFIKNTHTLKNKCFAIMVFCQFLLQTTHATLKWTVQESSAKTYFSLIFFLVPNMIKIFEMGKLGKCCVPFSTWLSVQVSRRFRDLMRLFHTSASQASSEDEAAEQQSATDEEQDWTLLSYCSIYFIKTLMQFFLH